MDHNIIEKFTTHLKSVLVRAHTLAHELGQNEITPDHLLWSLLTERGCLGAELLQKARISHQRLRETIAAATVQKESATAEPTTPALAEVTKRAIEKAVLTANLYDHKYVGTEHLLSGLLQIEDGRLGEFFSAEQIDLRRLKTQVTTALKSTSKFPDLALAAEDEPLELTAVARSAGEEQADDHRRQKHPGSKSPALDFFTVDLTGEEAQKRIDPVIGRAAEIERVIQILCRRTKNNPVLIGDPGVGKTAIVEGLAKRIAEGNVPDVLRDKRLLALDLPLLVAGTVYRGEFEGRLKQIIDEVKNRPEIILFIDEVHNIMGLGSASGSLDAANILKPALARGEIRAIGATTLTEYKKHIEPDPALERRFQPVVVREPSAEETRQILAGVRANYETFHAVTIADDALDAAVRFGGRYLQDKLFPDKAIDLIDEAAAAARIRAGTPAGAQKLKELEGELQRLHAKKMQAVRNERFAQALELKERETALGQEITAAKRARAPESAVSTIGEADVAEVVSRITGVPLANIRAEGGDNLADLEARLRRYVVGQDDALRGVAEHLRRARAGLTGGGRPLASFLFLGPSGVGKTSLAAAIAATVFGDPQALIRLDMSEFGESFTVSKLLGAPAGYVGYRETTKLTDAVKRRPYSVVLFDEVEKAHADVLNILLQILESGELTDATGRKVHFKQAVVALTSNVGSERFHRGALGFAAAGVAAEDLSAEMRRETEQHFRPELLNRLDKIFVFRGLTEADLKTILEREIAALNDRLTARGLTVRLSATALQWLARRGTDEKSGARAVRRIVEEMVEAPLAKRLLERSSGPRPSQLVIGRQNNALTYSLK